MIYLIGGAPRVGKSILARQLSKKTGISWMSTDVLRLLVVPYTPKADRAQKWPIDSSVWNRAKYTTRQRVAIQIREARQLETAIRIFVMEHLLAQDDIILEGVHLLPQTMRHLLSRADVKGKIRSVVFVDTDVDHVLAGIQKNSSHADWLRSSSTSVKREVASVAAQLSDYYAAEAKKHRIPVVEKTNDFAKDIAKAMQILLKK